MAPISVQQQLAALSVMGEEQRVAVLVALGDEHRAGVLLEMAEPQREAVLGRLPSAVRTATERAMAQMKCRQAVLLTVMAQARQHG